MNERADTASLLTTDVLEEYLARLHANDCQIQRDRDAGTVTVLDGEHRVLAAIQKGRGGPWIVRFLDSDRIHWARPEE